MRASEEQRNTFPAINHLSFKNGTAVMYPNLSRVWIEDGKYTTAGRKDAPAVRIFTFRRFLKICPAHPQFGPIVLQLF